MTLRDLLALYRMRYEFNGDWQRISKSFDFSPNELKEIYDSADWDGLFESIGIEKSNVLVDGPVFYSPTYEQERVFGEMNDR